MHSRRNSESSTNTATRAATEKSTFSSGSPKTDDFRTPEQYRRRSIANEVTSAIKHWQQGKRIFFWQSAAEFDTKQRCAHNTRRKISILAWKSIAWLSRWGSYTGEKKLRKRFVSCYNIFSFIFYTVISILSFAKYFSIRSVLLKKFIYAFSSINSW